MRTSTGIGLLALFGLFACSASGTVTAGGEAVDPAGGPGTTETDGTEPGASKDPTDPEAPPAPVVKGLAITDVAFFQAVKVPVVEEGQWVKSRNAPVVASRPALVRVYVSPEAGWTARDVTAEIRLVAGAQKFPLVRETKRITAVSKDEDPKSTFNLEVPAESLPPGVTFQVALTAEDGEQPDGASPARFPRDGSLRDLEAQVSGKLRIVIVPVKYDADGSGRVPDVSAAQLERYKKTFMARYAASEVEITARAPWSWTTPISRNGSGFSSVLNAITRLRQQEKAESDVYYYGALAPAASMSQFCGGGCVTGLSTVVENANTSFLRASVGVGFPGQDAVNTAAHEIGHAHGREHAPCGGASGVDPQFPYTGGQIGVWGYDMFAKTFISPTKGRDMMGYCPNEWVSDYTFGALFDRISAIATQKAVSKSGSSSGGGSFRIATVAPDGDVAWDGDIDLDEAPTGGVIRQVAYVASTGSEVATSTARFYAFDHLPGGILLVPNDLHTASAWSSVKVDGFAKSLAR